MNPHFVLTCSKVQMANVFVKLESVKNIPIGLYLFELEPSEDGVYLDKLNYKDVEKCVYNKAFMFNINTINAILKPEKVYLIICSTLKKYENSQFSLTVFFDNQIKIKKAKQILYKSVNKTTINTTVS
jgi:Calpain large subunit, domain III